MIALHKNGLDVFSVPCYFFEIILPALQGSAAVSAVRCSMERMIPSSVLLLSRSSNFFTAELLVPLKQMMHPRQIRLVRILFKFLGGILVRTRCGSKAPAMGPAKHSCRLNCIISLGMVGCSSCSVFRWGYHAVLIVRQAGLYLFGELDKQE